MPESTVDTDLVLKAAKLAPSVLPSATGGVIAAYLSSALLSKALRSEPDDEWDHVLDVANEVLVLADLVPSAYRLEDCACGGGYGQPLTPAAPPAAVSVPLWHVGDDPGVDRGLMVDAAQYVISHQHASSSAVQRNVRVGFAKAMRLLDLLETWGVIGPSRGALARVVLVPDEQRADVLAAIKGDAGA